VREYGQYCPVSIGSEALADRWTPLILREMVLGSTRFNESATCRAYPAPCCPSGCATSSAKACSSDDPPPPAAADRLHGPPSLTRAFGRWFLWSPFAPAVRERLAVQ